MAGGVTSRGGKRHIAVEQAAGLLLLRTHAQSPSSAETRSTDSIQPSKVLVRSMPKGFSLRVLVRIISMANHAWVSCGWRHRREG